jgi:hypothetical protein
LVFLYGVNRAIPDGVMGIHLQYSFAVIGVDLVVFVVGYFAWQDQRFRCRKCAARLRMPVATGNWSKATIFSPPKLEWICPFGHGTMREPEVQISGAEKAEWQNHKDDFWQAFEDAWRRDK